MDDKQQAEIAREIARISTLVANLKVSRASYKKIHDTVIKIHEKQIHELVKGLRNGFIDDYVMNDLLDEETAWKLENEALNERLNPSEQD